MRQRHFAREADELCNKLQPLSKYAICNVYSHANFVIFFFLMSVHMLTSILFSHLLADVSFVETKAALIYRALAQSNNNLDCPIQFQGREVQKFQGIVP